MADLLFDPENLDEKIFEKLKTYESFLEKWNKNVNIVSNGNSNMIWDRHIVDSLQMVPFLKDVNKLADMGSGIGLPSIPIAIACPGTNVFYIEPNQKKVALVSELIRELGISNIHLLPERVQSVVISHMDVVCCRAFGEFMRDSILAYKMLKPGGYFITYKADEEARIPNGFEKVNNEKYKLNNYNKDFHLVIAYKFGEFE